QPERPSPAADPFSLEPPPGPGSGAHARPADVFDLDLPAPPRRGGDDIFALEPAAPARPAAAPAPALAAVAEPEEEMEEEGVLFVGLGTRDSRRRYLDALGAEGLFSLAPWTSPVPVPPSPPPAPAAA